MPHVLYQIVTGHIEQMAELVTVVEYLIEVYGDLLHILMIQISVQQLSMYDCQFLVMLL
jgi:hypothetical protein